MENQEKVTRGIFYIFTRVILFVVAILIIALGFFTGMNSMNVNVIVKDAFAMREEIVLQPKSGDEADLSKLFTQDFIKSDAVLNSSAYRNYTVTSYYQRADVDMVIVWPWADRITVHATENVLDIIGTLNESEEAAEETASSQPQAKASAQATASDETQIQTKDKNPPLWASAEYDVTLVKDKEASSWKVDEMKLIREIEPVINTPSQAPATPSASKSSSKPPASPSATASGSAKPTKSAE